MLSTKQQKRAELVDTYWQLMRSGETNTSACRVLGMSRRSGTTIRRAHQYQTRIPVPRVVWSGRYLDVRERLQIADLLRLGFSVGRIAAELGRHPSTIKRELDRHRSPEGRYLPRTADHDARQSPGSPSDRNIPSRRCGVRFSYRMVPEVYQVFWAGMAAGEFINDAAIAAGSYRKQSAVGWLRGRVSASSGPRLEGSLYGLP